MRVTWANWRTTVLFCACPFFLFGPGIWDSDNIQNWSSVSLLCNYTPPVDANRGPESIRCRSACALLMSLTVLTRMVSGMATAAGRGFVRTGYPSCRSFTNQLVQTRILVVRPCQKTYVSSAITWRRSWSELLLHSEQMTTDWPVPYSGVSC